MRRCLGQPAVDQQAGGRIHAQLMAGAGNAVLGAVIFYLRIVHSYSINVALAVSDLPSPFFEGMRRTSPAAAD